MNRFHEPVKLGAILAFKSFFALLLSVLAFWVIGVVFNKYLGNGYFLIRDVFTLLLLPFSFSSIILLWLQQGKVSKTKKYKTIELAVVILLGQIAFLVMGLFARFQNQGDGLGLVALGLALVFILSVSGLIAFLFGYFWRR